MAFITHTMYKTIQWDAKHNSLPINLYQSLKHYGLAKSALQSQLNKTMSRITQTQKNRQSCAMQTRGYFILIEL
ncbi:hypothetical protein VCRA2121O157_40136 [Vibrio crassostreae]|uniref:Uncharacterized protein n=1 Tax=Vibrio crassostreae TaxID=246167 RepID=A0A822MY95_9VIBR|nr:hypothetical protein VCRA2119O47_100142 [Vibrio crassostreae]CAK1964364.1 hypothetical protein VCRA2114E122_20132 [Vibrio crassostreae]CAK1981328.1 hypothetical protein VCRA2118O144_20101 [Vibrio crassostreae]CAK2088701.1 hypothetical protein VCRA2113O137_30188 [Vibrio crassostreae]CAK2109718.1 hypothetical protein VCRA2113O138_40134 [Vibrio crassostreae]